MVYTPEKVHIHPQWKDPSSDYYVIIACVHSDYNMHQILFSKIYVHVWCMKLLI